MLLFVVWCFEFSILSFFCSKPRIILLSSFALATCITCFCCTEVLLYRALLTYLIVNALLSFLWIGSAGSAGVHHARHRELAEERSRVRAHRRVAEGSRPATAARNRRRRPRPQPDGGVARPPGTAGGARRPLPRTVEVTVEAGPRLRRRHSVASLAAAPPPTPGGRSAFSISSCYVAFSLC